VNRLIRIAFLLFFVLTNMAVLADGRIDKITITGNQRIEESTIKEYLGVKVGDNYSSDIQSQGVKNLYATQLFENIDIAMHGGNLIVTVSETPFISKVEFKGNTKVKSSLLTNEISTSAGESLRKSRLRADVEKIKEIYKRSGRFSLGVNAKVEPQENNRVKVIFEITEGPKTGISSIYFAGNNNYRDSELKSIILTKESRWFRFLETNDTYDPDRIEYDKHVLTEFYNSVGFADFRVISVTADLLPTREGFVVTYSVEEGDKYQFGDITLENHLSSIKDSDINKFISSKKGQTFNMSSMQKLSEKIAEHLAGRGYPQVEVHPDINTDRATKTVDVKIVVNQADKIFINEINIEGNLKTEDHVIRRQFKIAEGDVYNRAKIEKGEQNLRNLDYFGKLSVKVVPTDKRDRYNLNIDVEEKSTSSIGLDLGYNTAGGPFGRISFLERNLVGTGKYLNAGVQVGRRNTQYYAGLTDPNFLDRDLTLSGNVFNNRSGSRSGFSGGEQNYSLNSIGAKTSLGYDIVEDLYHELEYSIKRDVLRAPSSSSSRFIIEQMGKFTTSAIGQSLTFDQTDSRVIPKNGYLVTGSQEYAGVGGNTKYLKHELDLKAFKSFYENKYTVKVSGSVGDIRGVGGQKVRISDRFNLGDYSLRGFAYGGVGPRDKVTDEGLGGQKYYTMSTELSFPVGLPEEFNVTGAVFADAGGLWDVDSKASTASGLYNDKSMRASVGFGFLWVTKIAPIRMDWGFPIKKKPYDDEQRFHIKFSTHF
jgi:outer membrane protein insertion porin family